MSKITTGKKRFVKRQLSDESPTVWVGKWGLTEQLAKEIDKQLDKNKMVKVKILKSALINVDSKAIALNVAQQTGSEVVEVRGHTFMLFKARKK